MTALFSILKKPIAVLILDLVTFGTFWLIKSDFESRGAIPSGNYDWGSAGIVFYIFFAVVLLGAVIMLIAKSKQKNNAELFIRRNMIMQKLSLLLIVFMIFTLSACGNKTFDTTDNDIDSNTLELQADDETIPDNNIETTSALTEQTEPSDGIRPEIKEAIDSYEEFFDEYIEFMQSYAENNAPLDMLSDYLDYLTKYSDMLKKLNELNNEDLNDAELAYYLEVSARIN